MFHLYGYPILVANVNNETGSNCSFWTVWVAVQGAAHLRGFLEIYTENKHKQDNFEISFESSTCRDKQNLSSKKIIIKAVEFWHME